MLWFERFICFSVFLLFGRLIVDALHSGVHTPVRLSLAAAPACHPHQLRTEGLEIFPCLRMSLGPLGRRFTRDRLFSFRKPRTVSPSMKQKTGPAATDKGEI